MNASARARPVLFLLVAPLPEPLPASAVNWLKRTFSSYPEVRSCHAFMMRELDADFMPIIGVRLSIPAEGLAAVMARLLPYEAAFPRQISGFGLAPISDNLFPAVEKLGFHVFRR